jgi:hypothetical protein
MPDLNEFYRAERQRVFEPAPHFAERVVARIREETQRPKGLWESTLHATRPVCALALVSLLLLIIVRISATVEPRRGLVEAFLETEMSADDSLLYAAADNPPTNAALEDLILLENEP